MNDRPASISGRAGFAALVAALVAGSVAAQPPAVSVVSRNVGAVSIADLHALLDPDLQFQIFDFEAEEAFCLVFGYAHEIDGQPADRNAYNHVVCNQAGPQRLIVVMRPAGDKRILWFGLHDRNTGAGSTRSVAELPIDTDISGVAAFRPAETIRSDHETALFSWRFGPNPPHPGARHDVRILVRLDENDAGRIGSYPQANDFAE